jgi:aerobic carbon-monoxide dehydrogenase medium subunit
LLLIFTLQSLIVFRRTEKMYPASFEYHTPSSLDEAIKLMAQNSDAKLLAGGHSLLPAMKLRLATPATIIDMKKLRGALQYIKEDGNMVAIGALTTHATIAASKTAQQKIPLIAETASHIGDMQVRNLGTIGGALAHADPAADFPAAILASEAEMVIQGPSGKRTVKADEFFHGFFSTAVQPGEILVEIRVPVHKNGSYQKFPHPASGYAVAAVAVMLEKSGANISKCRVAVNGVSGGSYRAKDVEGALEGKPFSEEAAAAAAEHVVSGIDDVLEDPFATASYRGQLTKELARQAIIAAWNNAK